MFIKNSVLFCLIIFVVVVSAVIGILLYTSLLKVDEDDIVIDFVTPKKAAELYGLEKQYFTTEQIVPQMIVSTLGDYSLITQNEDFESTLYWAIMPFPTSYQLGNIYTLNYMATYNTALDYPIIIDDTFEMFLSAVNLARNRELKLTLLFSLHSFGSDKCLALSTIEVDDLGGESIYPWTPLQYKSLISQLGPCRKGGFLTAN